MQNEKTYVCIDLTSFYASVECADRGLDPFKDHLVVADPERTNKTICLAITPSMKALGISNRCRVFEIPKSIDYVMAKPRMRRYMEVSADIYSVYLRFVSPQDIHVYSIDECFIDATPYLALYETDARSFVKTLTSAVFEETGIRSAAGIGTNLFLAKVALDVTAKHASENIDYLDEESFRRRIWFHRPITDIWNVGPGIARRLEKYSVHDLAGVAAMSKDTLYQEFGANAEYLIDHAWGQEPCTIADIQAYEPEGHSMTNGQVLSGDYSFDEARMVMSEMVDASVLELVESGLVTDRISLYIGYARSREGGREEGSRAGSDASGWTGNRGEGAMGGNGAKDNSAGAGAGSRAGSTDDNKDSIEYFDGGHGKRPVGGARRSHGHTGGSRRLERRTNSKKLLLERFNQLFDETTRRDTPVRRINIGFGDLLSEEHATSTLFDDVEAEAKEHKLQETLVAVRGKFGKNAMLKGTSLKEKATARERNEQIGGHHA